MVRLPARAGESEPAGLTVPPTAQDRTAVEISITGLVQGVGFRPFVHRLAVRHGLDGWVRNRSDGTVEFLVQGRSDHIQQMLRWAGRGPSLARVDDIDTTDATYDSDLDSFEIRY